MAIHLAKPIAIYFASETPTTPGVWITASLSDAIVRDERRTIEGIAAIKTWRSETSEKYHHTVEPLSVTKRDGKTIVTAKVSGNFPGSPVNLDHVFELHGDRIMSLEIH